MIPNNSITHQLLLDQRISILASFEVDKGKEVSLIGCTGSQLTNERHYPSLANTASSV